MIPSVLLVIGGVDFFFCHRCVLAIELIELVIVKSQLGVLELEKSVFDRSLLVSLFFEHDGFGLKLSLKVGRLRVEPIVEGHSFP